MLVLNVLGPIVLIALIGYFFGRSKIDLHTETLSTLVILVAVPAIMFSSLTSLDVSITSILEVASAALICVFFSLLMSLVVIKLSGLSMRTFVPSLVFPNSGNMGLPLVLLAFGEEGLQLAVSYFVIIAILQHSLGMSISSGGFKPQAFFKQPLIYAVICVFVVVIGELQVPEVIMTTTKMLGGLMIPAMLILLGNSLAKLKVSDLKPAIIIAISRLAIGLTTALFAIWVLGLTGAAAGAVFLLSTMPTAVVNYVYAQRFRPDSEKIAGAVVVSTLLTFACLPFLISAAVWVSENSVS